MVCSTSAIPSLSISVALVDELKDDPSSNNYFFAREASPFSF